MRRRRIARGVLPVAAMGLACAAQPVLAQPVLSPYWTDHAVIQQGRPVIVEGTASPGERVEGMLGTESARSAAGKDGTFRLTFRPRTASADPVSLTVGDRTVRDLVFGDVWLCSGQSNMEFAVRQSLGAGGALTAPADPQLRVLKMPSGTAAVPRSKPMGDADWAIAGPDSLPAFSAACYFMAANLRQALKIPIGAVEASYGGSRLDPWLSPEAGASLYGTARLDMVRLFDRQPLAAVAAFARDWEAWYEQHASGQQPWSAPDALTWSPVPSIGQWNDWEGSPLQADPVRTVLLRRTIDLDAEQIRAGGTLSLGILDEIDMAFVNGHPVGNTFGWDVQRNYAVPAGMLHAGRNEILVALTNTWGTGGFSSPASALKWTTGGGQAIPLADGWRYSVAPFKALPPRSPWDGNAGLGLRHNAMVAPLGHVAMKGAAWYQGESDVDTPGYDKRLAALFGGWRAQFGAGMRMLVVQLANFGPPSASPAPSGWALLREEQRRGVAADANAALVPAIDLGERTDIHPANKVVLGERLALAAQGIALPWPKSAYRDGSDVVVAMSGVKDGLQAWSAAAPIALELCGDTQESCRYARGAITGSDLRLAGDGQPVTRVRYAWADDPVVNTFDARAIPVPGFELPVTQAPVAHAESAVR